MNKEEGKVNDNKTEKSRWKKWVYFFIIIGIISFGINFSVLSVITKLFILWLVIRELISFFMPSSKKAKIDEYKDESKSFDKEGDLKSFVKEIELKYGKILHHPIEVETRSWWTGLQTDSFKLVITCRGILLFNPEFSPKAELSVLYNYQIKKNKGSLLGGELWINETLYYMCDNISAMKVSNLINS